MIFKASESDTLISSSSTLFELSLSVALIPILFGGCSSTSPPLNVTPIDAAFGRYESWCIPLHEDSSSLYVRRGLGVLRFSLVDRPIPSALSISLPILQHLDVASIDKDPSKDESQPHLSTLSRASITSSAPPRCTYQPITAQRGVQVSVKNSSSPLRVFQDKWMWGSEKRDTPTHIYDAALDPDQGVIFLAGDRALWSWKIGRQEATPISLPPDLSPPLRRIFRDGPYWWVKGGGEAYLLKIDGRHSRRVARPQSLPDLSDELMIPLGGRLLRGHRGGVTLKWGDQHSLSAPLQDVASLSPDYVAVATHRSVDIWRAIDWRPKGKSNSIKREMSLPLPSTTVKVLAHRGTLFMIGAHYGVLWARYDTSPP
jgi:hypothetical protein